MSDQPGEFSIWRLLAAIVPIGLVAGGVYLYFASYPGKTADETQRVIIKQLLGPAPPSPDTPIDFKDEDGDMVADAPADDACVAPEKLVFSYIARPDQGETASHWQGVMDALGEATGLPVEFVPYENAKQQLTALASGELHVCAFNTGGVPVAVAKAGFVPVCTFGREDGEFSYTMKMIVPAEGGVGDLGELSAGEEKDAEKKQVKFVTPTSNSGFKAAFVLLFEKYNLLPETDYDCSFSLGHESSILGVAGGEVDAAPVASDLLERMIESGEVDEAKIKVVYESEQYPPAAIGYAYNLKPEVREKIAETLLAFQWAGTGIEGNYGGAEAAKFVPVSYKDDWASVRRIDEAIEEARRR
ncbi:MAG: phosphate/phosphite/phosphonate ABC transporter substrate-binding protein [Planctomycetota bacterium]